jgi:hypothetical protein
VTVKVAVARGFDSYAFRHMMKEPHTFDERVPPPWSSSDELEAAVRALAGASRKTHQAAYHRVLFAIGNGHARTYWPAALSLIPRLEELLRDGTELARMRALNVLLDLIHLFAPEPGFEVIETARGPRHLAQLVRAEIGRLASAVEQIEASTSSPREQRLAAEILAYVAERPAATFEPS